MNEIVDNELLAQRGLERVPLHIFSESARKGRYFQFPNREMLLGNTREGFSTIELDSIHFIKESKSQGIPLPKLIFVLSENDQELETKETVLDAEKV